MHAEWTKYAILAISLVIPIAASAFLTSAINTLARRANLVDRIGQDTFTTRALPRLGGIALYLAFMIGLGLTFVIGVDRSFDRDETTRLALLAIGAAIITTVMVADDITGLAPRTKLAWQIGTALLAVLPSLWNPRQGIIISDFRAPLLGPIELAPWIAVPFTVFWLVGMMNTMNMVDGLDGLAGGVTLIACTVLFIHTYNQQQYTISILPLILAGAAIGFLALNWHPAKIIMGDSGAMFLGFTLAAISIIGGAKLATTLLALAIPIIDLAWLIISRISHGRSPMRRDTQHLHHRLYQIGLTHRQVVVLYYSLCASFGALALILIDVQAKLFALLAAAIVVALILTALTRIDSRRRTDHAQ